MDANRLCAYVMAFQAMFAPYKSIDYKISEKSWFGQGKNVEKIAPAVVLARRKKMVEWLGGVDKGKCYEVKDLVYDNSGFRGKLEEVVDE